MEEEKNYMIINHALLANSSLTWTQTSTRTQSSESSTHNLELQLIDLWLIKTICASERTLFRASSNLVKDRRRNNQGNHHLSGLRNQLLVVSWLVIAC